jgi:hypothetical protein
LSIAFRLKTPEQIGAGSAQSETCGGTGKDSHASENEGQLRFSGLKAAGSAVLFVRRRHPAAKRKMISSRNQQ